MTNDEIHVQKQALLDYCSANEAAILSFAQTCGVMPEDLSRLPPAALAFVGNLMMHKIPPDSIKLSFDEDPITKEIQGTLEVNE